MPENKKYIVFSPINEYGGINIEVGFIVNLLAKNNEVEVISLGNYYPNALGELASNITYVSLDKIIYDQNILIRSITDFICKVKPLSSPNYFRGDNKLTKLSLIDIREKKLKIIKKAISNSDVILICSQLTSKYVREIIEIAFQQKKRIIFRLTGHIHSSHLHKKNIFWLRKVSTFIHHSSKSQETLSNYLRNSNNVIIDQTTSLEKELLKIEIKKKKVKKFFTLSRLHPVKNIGVVIEAFIQQCTGDDELNIYGDGEEESQLKNLAQNYPNIHFKGKVDYKDIPAIFEINDCLIISSFSEAGPLVAIESMAAGVPMITTNVGNQEDRLPNYSFFFNKSCSGLVNSMIKLKNLKDDEVMLLCSILRGKYTKNYSEKEIQSEYMAVLDL